MNTNKQSASHCQRCGAALTADAAEGLCPRCLLALNLGPQTQLTGDEPTARHPAPPPSITELAPLFPQLEILELLGRGGMGAVYRARQKQLDRIVALKILPPGVGSDAAFAARFATEARALAKLNHPNIVTLYEFGSAQLPPTPASPDTRPSSLFFFLMEFVDGMNLRQLLSASRLSPREALAIVPQICDALQYAHDAGIVHRDIKPENILLDRRGRVKVADFGLAKLVQQSGTGILPVKTKDELPATGKMPVPPDLTTADVVMGTPQYMAPEQREHPTDVDHRADIYSLGVVFYQMLTGELPQGDFAAPSKRVLVDVRLDEVVLRAMEKRPELRYQHVSDVKTMVETIAGTPAPRPATAEKPEARASASASATPHYHRAESFSERWAWDATLVWCVTFLLVPLPGILAACLVPTLGPKALFFLLLELVPLLNAVIYFSVLRRVDRLRDSVPADALELAEGLLATRTKQSPCLAALSAGRLDLLPVTGAQIGIPLSDIEAVTEVRWISGRRLWWKRGLKIQRRSAPPVVLALAEPVFHRWQPLLAGAVQKLAAQPSRAAVTPAPVESPSRIITRNIILIFSMAFGVVAIPIALASPYPWKQFGLICAPIMIVVGFLRLIGKWPFPALFPASAPPPHDDGVTPAAPLAPKFQSRLRVAAIGLLVTGAANALLFLLGCFGLLGAVTAKALPMQANFGFVPLVLFFCMSFVTLFGALQCLRLRGYALATAGSVLAIITLSPLLPVGIGFGLMSLLLLCRAEVRQAFQSNAAARTADEPQQEAASEPRFSRTAIVGACWAPLCFIAFVLMLCKATATPGEYHGPAWWQMLMMIVLGGLGLTAPFGTTILGWIAVAQIRRSAGKLFGLGLAVFDGLLFPLLLLDGICVGVLVGLSRIFVELYANFSNVNNPQVSPPFVTRLANLLSQHPEITWLVAVLLVLIVDFLIIRAVWRAVTKPVSPKVPSLGKNEVAPFQSLENVAQPPSRFSRTAITGALCLLAIPIGLLLNSVATLHTAQLAQNDELRWVWGLPGIALVLLGQLLPTLLGWIAVAQIRRAAGKLRGMGLAVFNGLLFPLLALDVLILATDLSGRWHVTGPGRTPGVTMAQLNIPTWQMLLVFGLIVIVDVLIIRAVWRAVNKGSAPQVPSIGKTGVAEFQALKKSNTPRSILACCVAYSSGLFAAVAWMLMLSGQSAAPWDWGILITALLGMTLAIGVHRTSCGKHALWFGGIQTFVWLFFAVFFSVYDFRGLPGLERVAGAGAVQRSPFPIVANVTRTDGTVLIVHDNVDAQYLFCSAKPIGTTDSSWRNTLAHEWEDLGTFNLTDKREFRFERHSRNPLHLKVNGNGYDLRKGRVFLPHEDGTVEQRQMEIPLAQALKGAAPQLIRANMEKEQAFGPVIEQTIALGNASNSFYSTARADFVPGPQDLQVLANDTALWKWLTEHDVDFLVRRDQGRPVLTLSDMVATSCQETDFERWTPDALMHNAALQELMLKPLRPNFQSPLSGNFGGKITLAFQTRYGRFGLVQVIGVGNHPPSLTLRYKLVQEVGATQAATTKPTVRAPQAVTATGSLEPATNGAATTWACKALVAEFDMASVDVGQKVRLTLEAFPKRVFHGKVTRIGNAAPVVAQNYVTYETMIEIADPDPKFRAGMSANVLFMVTQPAIQTNTATVATPAFGPVMERVLPFGAPCEMLGLQFRSGRLFVNGHGPGTTEEQAAADWKLIDEAGGLDATAQGGTDALQFCGVGCLFLKAVAPQWKAASAADVVAALKDTTWIVGMLQPTREELPLTAYFKTERGEMGILQLLDIVEDARGYVGNGAKGYGVKLRYKLVQAATAAQTAAAQPPSAPAASQPRGAVELVALAKYPSQGSAWWTPDGTVLAEPPVDANPLDIRSTIDPKEKWLTAVFRVPGGLDDMLGDILQRVDGGKSFCPGRQLRQGKPLEELLGLAFGVPENETHGQLTIRVPRSAWWTELTVSAEPLLSGGKTTEDGFVFSARERTNDALVIAVGHLTDKRQWRVAYWHKGSMALGEPVYGAGSSPAKPVVSGWRFSDIKLSDAGRFTLQSRPYEEFAFRDIALQPRLNATTGRSGFGPVVEQTVAGAIDFDSGKTAELPESVTKSNDLAQSVLDAIAWMEREGFDAINETSRSLKGVDIKAALLSDDAWEQATPEKIYSTLALVKTEKWLKFLPLNLVPDHAYSKTWAFQTREGAAGLLQILSVTNDGVKLRYKLVQSGATNAAKVKTGTPDAAAGAADHRKFPAMELFINNHNYGDENGCAQNLLTDGSASCGHPGHVSEVSWIFLRSTPQGDVYKITRKYPADLETPKTETKEITYAGETLVLWRDGFQKIVLRPSTPSTPHAADSGTWVNSSSQKSDNPWWHDVAVLEKPDFAPAQLRQPLGKLRPDVRLRADWWQPHLGELEGQPATRVEVRLPEELRQYLYYRMHWRILVFNDEGKEMGYDGAAAIDEDKIKPGSPSLPLDPTGFAYLFKVSTGEVRKVVLQYSSVQEAMAKIPKANTPPTTPAFGPVVERVVPNGGKCLNLLTGQLLPLSGLMTLAPDVRSAQGDVYWPSGENDTRVLWILDCRVLDLDQAAWSKLSAAALEEKFQQQADARRSGTGQNETRLPPGVYGFRGYQKTGLLQIIADTNNYGGVKLRYKLVQTGATNAVATHGGR